MKTITIVGKNNVDEITKLMDDSLNQPETELINLTMIV